MHRWVSTLMAPAADRARGSVQTDQAHRAAPASRRRAGCRTSRGHRSQGANWSRPCRPRREAYERRRLSLSRLEALGGPGLCQFRIAESYLRAIGWASQRRRASKGGDCQRTREIVAVPNRRAWLPIRGTACRTQASCGQGGGPPLPILRRADVARPKAELRVRLVRRSVVERREVAAPKYA